MCPSVSRSLTNLFQRATRNSGLFRRSLCQRSLDFCINRLISLTSFKTDDLVHTASNGMMRQSGNCWEQAITPTIGLLVKWRYYVNCDSVSFFHDTAQTRRPAFSSTETFEPNRGNSAASSWDCARRVGSEGLRRNTIWLRGRIRIRSNRLFTPSLCCRLAASI